MNHDFERGISPRKKRSQGPTRQGRFGKAGFLLQGTIRRASSARDYPQGTIRADRYTWLVGWLQGYLHRWVHFPKGDQKEKKALDLFRKKKQEQNP